MTDTNKSNLIKCEHGLRMNQKCKKCEKESKGMNKEINDLIKAVNTSGVM